MGIKLSPIECRDPQLSFLTRLWKLAARALLSWREIWRLFSVESSKSEEKTSLSMKYKHDYIERLRIGRRKRTRSISHRTPKMSLKCDGTEYNRLEDEVEKKSEKNREDWLLETKEKSRLFLRTEELQFPNLNGPTSTITKEQQEDIFFFLKFKRIGTKEKSVQISKEKKTRWLREAQDSFSKATVQSGQQWNNAFRIWRLLHLI